MRIKKLVPVGASAVVALLLAACGTAGADEGSLGKGIKIPAQTEESNYNVEGSLSKNSGEDATLVSPDKPDTADSPTTADSSHTPTSAQSADSSASQSGTETPSGLRDADEVADSPESPNSAVSAVSPPSPVSADSAE